jgi:hypothetical protein
MDGLIFAPVPHDRAPGFLNFAHGIVTSGVILNRKKWWDRVTIVCTKFKCIPINTIIFLVTRFMAVIKSKGLGVANLVLFQGLRKFIPQSLDLSPWIVLSN